MTTKQKSVLLSVLMLVLCLALVAGGTYALFSDDVTLTNHLEAGTLDITLKRTKLETLSLDNNTGYLAENVNTDVVDFSTPNDRNVFDIEDGVLIVPCSSYTATMEITNDVATSDVAFSYWLEIRFGSESDLELADQLKVVLTTEDGVEHEVILSNGAMIGSEGAPIGTLAKTASETFKISVEFLDLDNNNDAKSKKVSFDLIVHAVQAIKAPTATP